MNRNVRDVFACLYLCFALLFSSFATAATRWDNPKPQGNVLSDVAWNGSRYLAIGHVGTILTSTNGVDWTAPVSGTKAWLHAVRWTGTQFIVVGNSGTILTSPNGTTWTRQVSGTTNYLYGVAWNGNTAVVVGSSGLVLTSNDLVHWTARSSGGTDWLNDVEWNGQEFVAVGASGAIVASANGLTWSARNSPVRTQTPDGSTSGPSLEGVAWSPVANRWVVVGEGHNNNSAAYILTSADGINWTVDRESDRALNAVSWDNERFVAVGNGGLVLSSTTGLGWTPVNTGQNTDLEASTAGGAGHLLVGEYGTLLAGTPGGTWTRHSTGDLNLMYAVAARDGGYVAVGDGVAMYRAGAGQPFSVTTGLPALRGIAASGSEYIAVGLEGVIRRSIDGNTWSSDSAVDVDLFDVASIDANAWLAVGANGNMFHNDGTGWDLVPSGTGATLRAVAVGGQQFIAVGDGVLLTGTDGNNWTVRNVPGVSFRGAAVGNGRRVAVGENGAFATLVNGTWTDGNVGTVWTLNDVFWDGRRFVAVGDRGTTFVSTNGINWAPQIVTGNSLQGVAMSGSGFLAVGEGGTVVSSACPCASEDTATTTPNRAVTINVLANDTGDDLVVRAHDVNSNRGGSVRNNGDGTLTYTPPRDVTGVDVFTYTVGSTSSPDSTDTASVTVTISGSVSGSNRNGGGGGGGSAASLLGLLLLACARRGFRRAAA